MLPLVNRPMMEHIIDLLKRTASTRSSSPSPSWPTRSAPTSATAPSSACSMVYATEETPLGTAGSVRNAMDAARRAVPRDLRRRAHRHRPRRHRRLPRRARAPWPPSAWPHVENPLEFGIVITREDGRIERFLEKPTWGQVFSDTINTGIFVLEPEIFDYIEADRPVDFSERGVPQAAGRRTSRCTAPSPRATGRTSARSTPTSRAHKDILDGAVAGQHPRLRAVRRRVAGRGRRDPPRGHASTGPAVIGDNCRIEAGARIGEYTVLGANVRVRSDAELERTVVNDNAYLGEAVRLRGTVVGRACDLRNGRPLRGRRRPRRRVLHRRGAPCSARASRSTRSRRSRPAPSSTTSIVWESRGRPQPVRRATASPGLANVDITPEFATKVAMAYGVDAQEGLDGHHVARLEPVGPHAQAGDDGRAQRGRRQRRGPRGGLGAGHPVHRAPPGQRRRHHHPAGPRRPAVGGHPLLRRATASTSPRTPSARSSGCSTARTSAGCSPARSATSASPPRALEHYATALEATVDVERDPRRPSSRSSSTTRYGSTVVRHAERAGQARRSTCWRSTRSPPPPG